MCNNNLDREHYLKFQNYCNESEIIGSNCVVILFGFIQEHSHYSSSELHNAVGAEAKTGKIAIFNVVYGFEPVQFVSNPLQTIPLQFPAFL